jgi:hypothetical protein
VDVAAAGPSVENTDELAAALQPAEPKTPSAPDAAHPSPAPTESGEPITPTASTGVYPMTPYPPLDFASALKAVLAEPIATPPAAVAESSAADAVASPTPR